MDDRNFEELENFIIKNRKKFGDFNRVMLKKRKRTIYDFLLKKLYFSMKNANT